MNAARPCAPLGPTGLAARTGGTSYVIIKTNHKPLRVGPVQASTLGPVLVTAPSVTAKCYKLLPSGPTVCLSGLVDRQPLELAEDVAAWIDDGGVARAKCQVDEPRGHSAAGQIGTAELASNMTMVKQR